MNVHVTPTDDLIEHSGAGCICGPLTEPVTRADGSMGWVIVHHSLDGRELCGQPTGVYDVACARPAGHEGGHVGPFWVEPHE